MRSHELTHAGLRLARWRSRHNLRQVTFWTMVALGPLLAVATFAVLERDAVARRRQDAPPGAARRLRLRAGRRRLRRAARRRDDRRAAAAVGRLEAAHAAGALLHRHRADPDDPRRGLRHDHAELRARGLVLRPGAQRRDELDGRGRRPTRRSIASRCRPTRSSLGGLPQRAEGAQPAARRRASCATC